MAVLHARIGKRRVTFVGLSPMPPRPGITSPSTAHPAMQAGAALAAAQLHIPILDDDRAQALSGGRNLGTPCSKHSVRRVAPKPRPILSSGSCSIRRPRLGSPAQTANLEGGRRRRNSRYRRLRGISRPPATRTHVRAGCRSNGNANRPQAVPKRIGWAPVGERFPAQRLRGRRGRPST